MKNMHETVKQYLEICKENPLWKKPGDDLQKDINYLWLGMLAELGEVAELYQKNIRDGALIDPKDVLDELGDVSFYVHMLAAKGFGDIMSCKRILSGEVCVLPEMFDPVGLIRTLKALDLEGIYSIMILIGRYYGFSLEDILNANVTKLKRRIKNGTIHGSGSHR